MAECPACSKHVLNECEGSAPASTLILRYHSEPALNEGEVTRLTGRENITLNGTIPSINSEPALNEVEGTSLGMTKSEIDKKFDETCPEPVEGLWIFPGWRSLLIQW